LISHFTAEVTMGRLAVKDQLAGLVARQRQEQIRVNVRRAGGQRILDIRVFVEDDLGRWIPTGRGVALKPAEYQQLREVLDSLKDKRGTHE
jgi:hypothetical protein